MTCKCHNIPIGSYGRQIWVHAPAHMPKDNGYCLDLCIAQEVMAIWRHGVTTTGCCCGHNLQEGYIGVLPEDSPKMLSLGYEKHHHPDDHPGCFKPKYDMLL